MVVIVALVVSLKSIAGMPAADQAHLLLGRWTWLVPWVATGAVLPVFVWLSRGYSKVFVVLTAMVYVIAWLALGMKCAGISEIGMVDVTMIDRISDVLNIVALAALCGTAVKGSGSRS
ncbi:hypothetical protein [Bifidobacterium simiarum]|uniref:Uncharacterized protein n=1 Tax=Bifidobacterium simiarum TaxID=2045441 RepID=A0A2M9HCD6_9BIFI|nr:hypothetical protein [Bifidobacterium simiarum]PJM74480.1 hypothetical protein CSQ87_09875 [Bifidobacterium simiarum]